MVFLFGLFIGFWSVYDVVVVCGVFVVLMGGLSMIVCLELIRNFCVIIICCMLSYVLYMVEVVNEN